MSIGRQVRRGLRALLRRADTDREIADEVAHYLEQAVAEQRSRGVPQSEALRAARLELGGPEHVRERVRGYGWENLVEELIADVRVALRRLRTRPVFTAIAVFTLALGVGASTAIFSAVKPVLFERLPYPRADRMAAIWELADDGGRNDGTFGMYRELAARSHTFEALAVMRPWQPTMTGGEQPERFAAQRVSASYFEVLGVAPGLGRAFHADDDRLNGPNVVLLSDGLWRRRFGGDRAIVGRAVTLDETPFVVIGVMPPDFENVLSPSAELWAPLQYDLSQGRAWGHHLRMVGRLNDGASLGSALQELNLLGQTVVQEQQPQTYGLTVQFGAAHLQQDLTRAVRPALVAILGAVLLLLVIVCVNVTNLLLARNAERHGEFALRAALGAGQPRLVRQLLTESLVLSGLGGVAGLAGALWSVRVLVRLSPPELPRLDAIDVDGVVWAAGLGLSVLIGIAFGLLPARQACSQRSQRVLQQGARRTLGGHRRVGQVLVVSEVALALVLLVSSGLLLRSLQRLFAIDSGFDAAHVLTMQVQTSGPRFQQDSTTYRFFAQSLDAVRRVPGVQAAALTSQLPLSGDYDQYGITFEPQYAQDPGERKGTFRYAVSPGYFQTMRIPLRRGRLLNELDVADAEPVAIISESLARRRLPGLDPIGQRLRIGTSALYTVVGVVSDVKQLSLALSDAEAVYVTAAQWRFADQAMSLVVRARTDAAMLAAPIQQAIWTVDRDQPIERIAEMEALLAASAAERRFTLLIIAAFALTALFLAAAGIYGILAGNVAERSREIGLRSALGASGSDILALVLRQGMALTGLGLVLGTIGAAAAGQVLITLLFGVSPLDPITYVGTIALLGAVALLACAVPAWRAARLDPATTLRLE